MGLDRNRLNFENFNTQIKSIKKEQLR